MFKRTCFQHGCLTRRERRRGPDVWVFQFRETGSDGKRIQRKVTVGTVEQYRTRAAAEQAIAALRVDINKEDRFGALRSMTVGQLTGHYEQKELQGEKSN